VITITSELLESWEVSDFIPKELLPMEVMRLFEAPIPSRDKVRVLLREEVLGRRGLVYVAARAARRARTVTGWYHSDSLRALDLCDRYAAGEDIQKEELERAIKAAEVASSEAASSWAARAAANAARAIAVPRAAWTATSNEEIERRSQLTDCRDWLLRGNPQERAPILTRYQRIMRSL